MVLASVSNGDHKGFEGLQWLELDLSNVQPGEIIQFNGDHLRIQAVKKTGDIHRVYLSSLPKRKK